MGSLQELEELRADWLRRRAVAQQTGLEEAFANALRPAPVEGLPPPPKKS